MKKVTLSILIYLSLSPVSNANCLLAANKRLLHEISYELNKIDLPLKSLIVNKMFKFYTRPSRDGNILRHEFKADVSLNGELLELKFPVFESLENGNCR